MAFADSFLTRVRKKINQPQVIKTDLIGTSFSFWPFVVLGRNRKSYSENASQEDILLHEKTHWNEQKGAKLVPWLLKYAFSSGTRLEAEKRAYEAEIRNRQSRKEDINYDSYIRALSNYTSVDDAKQYIAYLQETNPYKG